MIKDAYEQYIHKEIYQFSNGNSQYSLSYVEKLVRAIAAIKCWGGGWGSEGDTMVTLYRGPFSSMSILKSTYNIRTTHSTSGTTGYEINWEITTASIRYAM